MPKIIKKLSKGTVLVSLILLAACSHQGTRKPHLPGEKTPPEEVSKKKTTPDGPPLVDIDVSHIPNATPKVEPLSKYGNMSSYEVFGNRYHVLPHSKGYKAEGTASWYGTKFHGRKTSSGEPYDMFSMTAAHRSLPLPTYVSVENLKNGRKVIVKVNDRGPFVQEHHRVIDLSYAAAKKLGIHETGTGKVRITAIDPIHWHKQQKAIMLAEKAKPKGKHKDAKEAKETALALADKPLKDTAKKADKKTVASQTTTLAKADKNSTTKGESLIKVAQAQSKKGEVNAAKQIYIQLGAFNKKLNAQQLAEHASALTQAANHINVHVLPSKVASKDLYKVRVGPLKTEEEANQLKKKLVALNGTGQVKLVYE